MSTLPVLNTVVHPLDHVEGVHDPPRVGAAALDQLPYPPRAVGGHHLYGAPLLARELVEEQVEHVLAGALNYAGQRIFGN